MARFLESPEKTALLRELLEGYATSLKASNKFAAGDEGEERPSVIINVQLTLASLYDALNEHTKALDTVNEAIAHTPTLIELYLVKAKIYKVGYDVVGQFRENDLLKQSASFLGCTAPRQCDRGGAVDGLCPRPRHGRPLCQQQVCQVHAAKRPDCKGRGHCRLLHQGVCEGGG